MRLTYDSGANASYISLIAQSKEGQVKNTIPCELEEINGEIFLDFDEKGFLIGIEIIGANRILSKSTLEKAELIE